MSEAQTKEFDTETTQFPHRVITTLADVSRLHAQRIPLKLAMRYGGRSTCYTELDRYASQIANGLTAEGLNPQSRVALIDTNSDRLFEVLFGCAKANAVFCPVNWRLANEEMAYVVNDCEAEILFVGEKFQPIVEAIEEQLLQVKKIIILSGQHSRWDTFESWRNSQLGHDPFINNDAEAIAVQIYTSGTTGNPKGVLLSHRALVAINTDDRDDIAWNVWGDDDISLLAMPCFHIGGLRWGLMGLIPGCLNIILTEFDPAQVLSTIEAHRISKLFLVPAALQFVMQLPACKATDFSSLKHIIYGASPIPSALLRKAIAVFQCGFVQLYGLTETTAQTTYLPLGDHDSEGNERMNSAGRPLPYIEIQIRDGDGRQLPAREVGEICIKSPSNMSGYWKRPVETADTLVNGWIKTGDAGFLDEDGYVFIRDRIKDIIISGGENIYPAEIENTLRGHPAIAEAAVIGVPDSAWGEAVKAVVVPKPGFTISAEDIIAFAKARIASYKVPKSVDFVTSLPRNAAGKLLKKEIRAPYWKSTERSVN